jgi:uncharacterized OsmC-like protein
MNDTRIREAIEILGDAISADPAKARAKGAPATARLSAGLTCEVSGPQGQRMITDMPPAMGGAAAAPNPGWYLRGAIASCLATVIAMRAAKLGIALETLEVTVESDSDHRGILGLDQNIPAGQTAVRTTVKIGGHAEPQKLREIVAWAEGHSPVGCTMNDPPRRSLDIQVL